MSDKLTTQEENGEKVFTVELEPGSEVTMQTADTYVDKNIRVKAKSVDPITYTGGTGIDVDNDTYTISVDDTVVTTSKLASGELQAIDLDPTSSHVISQVFTATESYLGPTYLLYTFNKETGQLDPNPHGGMFYETEGLDNSIVAILNEDSGGQVSIGASKERPTYYNTTSQEFTDISLVGDVGKLVQNDEGKWEPFTEQIYTKEFAVGQNTNTGYYTSLTTSELMMQDENIIQMFTRYAVPNWDELSSVEQEQYAQDFGVYFGSENYPLYLMGKGGRPIYADGEDVHELAYITDFSGTAVDGKWTSLTINGTTASIGGGSESSYGDDDVKTLLSSKTVQSIELNPNSSAIISQVVSAVDGFIGPAYGLYTTDDEGKLQPNASGGLYVEDDVDYKMVAMVAEKENLNVVLASHNQRPYYIDLSKDEDPHPQEGIALLSDLIAGEGTITVRQAQIISLDPIVFEPTDDQKAIFNDAMKMTLYVDADDLDGKRYIMQRQYDESGDKVRYTSVTPYIEQRGSTETTLGTTTTSLVYDKANETFQVSQFLQWFVDGTAEDGIWKSMTIGNTTANFPQGGGGGGEPDAYIKNASISGKTLTLIKKDNTTVTFTDTNTEYTQGTGIKITGTEISADETVVATKTDLQDKINRDEAEETIVSILTAMHLNRYYTGANVPQSSLGQDGDIYLQE